MEDPPQIWRESTPSRRNGQPKKNGHGRRKTHSGPRFRTYRGGLLFEPASRFRRSNDFGHPLGRGTAVAAEDSVQARARAVAGDKKKTALHIPIWECIIDAWHGQRQPRMRSTPWRSRGGGRF